MQVDCQNSTARAAVNDVCMAGGDCPIAEATTCTEYRCQTLLMCIVTVFDQGIRHGGGIGEMLMSLQTSVRKYKKIRSAIANGSWC